MFGHFAAYKSIGFTSLVLSTPDLGQLVNDLLATYFLPAHRSLVTLASAPRSVSYSRFGSLVILHLLIDHIASSSGFFDGDQRF